MPPLLHTARDATAARPGRVHLVAHDWSTLAFGTHPSKKDRERLTNDRDRGYDPHLALLVDAADGATIAPLDLTPATATEELSARVGGITDPPAAHVGRRLPAVTAIAALDLPARLVHVIDRKADSIGHGRQWDPTHEVLVRADDRRVMWNDQPAKPSLLHTVLKKRGEFRDTRAAKYRDRKGRPFVAETVVTLHRPAKTTVEGKAVEVAGRPLAPRLVPTEARDRLQRRLADAVAELPPDPLGVVGVIDETSALKKGEKTPGVQRQYLGCVGKIDNGIVTVHVGVTKGHFQALLDAELYLPQSWATDRQRCRAAGIPDDVRYRSKWRIALDQLIRSRANGVTFDWLTFDEGYGSKGPFLWVLGLVGQTFVAEVPTNFSVRNAPDGPPRRADAHQPGCRTKRWRRYRIGRKTQADQVWRARRSRVWAARRWHTLVTAVNEATGEVKYFVTNAVGEPLGRILAVAFRRATVEHAFRVAKTEAGLTHFEGRQYVGLVRHLILTLIVLGFVAVHTERLRGEKSAGDAGAGVPGVERGVPDPVPSATRDGGPAARRRGDPVPPAAERAGHAIPQETAAQVRAQKLKPRCNGRTPPPDCDARRLSNLPQRFLRVAEPVQLHPSLRH